MGNNENLIIVNPTVSIEVIGEQLLANQEYSEVIKSLNSENALAYALTLTHFANSAAKKGEFDKQKRIINCLEGEFQKSAIDFLEQSAACRNYYLNNGVGPCPKTPTFDIDNSGEILSIYLNEAYKPVDEEASLF